jgi:hypothetical protein
MDLRIPTESTIGRSGQEANCRLINGYAETLGADTDGKSRFVIYPDPGLAIWSQRTYTAPSRGLVLLNDTHLLALLGQQLVQFATDGSSAVLLNLTGSDRMTMARNLNVTTQVAMVSDGGTYTLLSNGAVTNPTTGFSAPNSVCYLRGFFVFTTPEGLVFHSASDDGTTFNALSFGYAQSEADTKIRAYASAGFLYIFGARSMEIWTDAGTTPFAFAPLQQFIHLGLMAKYSIAENDKGLIWVDHNGIVRFGRDGGAQRVSTHSVERAIEMLSDTDRPNMSGSYFAIDGHEFYALSSTQWTWVYDLSMQRWHERISYGDVRWHGDQTILFNGHYVSSDYRNGTLYQVDSDEMTEGGNEFVLELWLPYMHNFSNSLIIDRVDLDIIAGEGNISGTSADDINPVITIDYSDNGGKIFRGERAISAGSTGKFSAKVRANRWGRSDQKGRIWRVRAPSRILRGLIQAAVVARPCA